jgi:hypothetical protein
MGSLNATGAGTAGAYPNDRGEQSSGVSWQRKRLHRADLSLSQLSDQPANNPRVRTDEDAPWSGESSSDPCEAVLERRRPRLRGYELQAPKLSRSL